MHQIWTTLSHLFSVTTTAITVLGYPLSYLELLGTVFNLWSVWLVARNRMLTWPVGLIGVVLFLALFYQIQLYADTIEQVYYLGASIYGWWHWTRAQRSTAAQQVRVSGRAALVWWALGTLLTGLGLGWITGSIHQWVPALFPVPATFALLDAMTTAMSFTAMLLMARRRLECWIYWILVDGIGIGLYAVKEVRFVAVLYVVFLGLALHGLRTWHCLARQASTRAGTSDLPA